jgi:hypothetical protein
LRLSFVAVLAAAFLLSGCGDGGQVTSTETTPSETTTSETTTSETMPTAPEPTTVTVVVEGGVPKGGIVRATVDKGTEVVLVVKSDVSDEIHIHGYDLSKDVPAGGEARIRFMATIPGRFEVELEERGTQIADLTVQP